MFISISALLCAPFLSIADEVLQRSLDARIFDPDRSVEDRLDRRFHDGSKRSRRCDSVQDARILRFLVSPPCHITVTMTDPRCDSYRLFLLSFAVQHALDNPDLSIDLASYCMLSYESASNLIVIARDCLGPIGVLKYGIDSTYVYLSYAATFLLKVRTSFILHLSSVELTGCAVAHLSRVRFFRRRSCRDRSRSRVSLSHSCSSYTADVLCTVSPTRSNAAPWTIRTLPPFTRNSSEH